MTDQQPEQPRPQEEPAPQAADEQARQQRPPEPPPWPTIGSNWRDAPEPPPPPPSWESAPWGQAADQAQAPRWEPPPAYQPGPVPPAYTPYGHPPAHRYYPGARIPDAEARNWAVAAHLSPLLAFLVGLPFLGPLVVWMAKRHDHPYIAEQAREALNFNLSMFIYTLGGGIISLVLTLFTFGLFAIVALPVLIILSIVWLVLVIVGSVKASNGEAYRYPLTMRMVD